MIIETFGCVQNRPKPWGEYLDMAFSPLSAPLRSRWRNNGLSADFLGDYVTTFLPKEDGFAADASHQREIKHAVSYIANELLENAMKYHHPSEREDITIRLELSSELISVSSTNGASCDQARQYKDFIDALSHGHAGDLLVKHIEESAKRGEAAPSGLGLLTMIADYGAELGWRFVTKASEAVTVTTHAELSLKNIFGGSAA